MEVVPILADVCRFYGWTLEYCLGMPAHSFFAFATEARRVGARERLQESKLHMLPAMNIDYFKQLREEYINILHPPKPVAPEERPAAMAWDDPHAQAMIRQAFSDHRRSRYGR